MAVVEIIGVITGMAAIAAIAGLCIPNWKDFT